MVISYKKLWKLLIDKDMKKQDLRTAAQLSSSTVAKLTHGENVSTAVLLKICAALQCDISDIMEVVPEGSPASEEQPQERM
jgi:DNA-binding Xre family transcriptional regulator